MDFSSYLQQAWQAHANDAQKVEREFPTGFSLAQTNDQLLQLAGLITHVMGEHLARWDEGTLLLKTLKNHSAFLPGTETEKTVARSIAALQIGGGQEPDLDAFDISSRVRILATAAGALCARDTKKAQALLVEALEFAAEGLEKNDPANRTLAVTGNNLACALEEKSARTSEENELMIMAAKIARSYWELAGTWLEVSRAEYRLAMSYLQAGEDSRALEHARTCLEICELNNAGDVDMFFAYEAIAKVERKRGSQAAYQQALANAKAYFAKMTAENQSWCEASLERLK